MPLQFWFELIFILVVLALLTPMILFLVYLGFADKGHVKSFGDFVGMMRGQIARRWRSFLVFGAAYLSVLTIAGSFIALNLMMVLLVGSATLAGGLTEVFGFKWKDEQSQPAQTQRTFFGWLLIPLGAWFLVAALVSWIVHGLNGWWAR